MKFCSKTYFGCNYCQFFLTCTVVLVCECRMPKDRKSPMISCTSCRNMFHISCVKADYTVVGDAINANSYWKWLKNETVFEY